MLAEIIAIGDELTSGARLDTNSQWLSQELADLGIRVIAHTTIADDIDAMVNAIQNTTTRCDIAICSGGLGPTADDLTRHAFAKAAGVEMILNEEVLAHIRDLFARRKREMPVRNKIQAEFPDGSTVISNPHGSAPGFEQVINHVDQSARFFTLPGVPAELKEMFVETVKPRIIGLLGSQRKWIQHRVIKCFGVGESDLEAMLPDLIRRGREPTVGITVSQATITLRISAHAESPEDCRTQLDSTELTIRESLGDLVYGVDEEQLEHAIVRLLGDAGKSVCTVEVGTCGMISKWMSLADEGGNVFRGGRVLADREPSFSEIAQHFREESDADYCLATGPFPNLDIDESSRDHFSFMVVTESDTISDSKPFRGHPAILNKRAAKQALDLLRKTVIQS